MATDYITILEKITYEEGKAVGWFRSFDEGKTWEQLDCSMYPGGRPPFIILNADAELAYICRRLFESKPHNSASSPTAEDSQ